MLLPVGVVSPGVVAAQRCQSTKGDSVGEEYLRARVHPHLTQNKWSTSKTEPPFWTVAIKYHVQVYVHVQ